MHTTLLSTLRRCIPRFYQLSEDASSGLKVSQLDVKETKILLQCRCHHAEEIMGQAFRELGWKRSGLVVSTKIFWGLSRKHIVEATPMEETVRAMNYVIDHGCAFYWGTSESSTDLISDNLRFSCFRLPPLLEKIR